MRSPRHVLMDLDGSILDGSGSICPRLASLVQSTPDTHWIIVTGRGFASAAATPVARYVSRRAVHVFDGGATFASFDGHQVRRTILTRRELRLARSFIRIDHVTYIYASIGLAGGVVWARQDENIGSVPVLHRTASIGAFWREIKRHPVSKLTILQHDPVQSLKQIWHTRNEGHVDVTRRGVNKATGARCVFQALDLDPADSIFIFNDENDVSVLKLPFFKEMTLLKVGHQLPHISSHFHAQSPRDVASILLGVGIGAGYTHFGRLPMQLDLHQHPAGHTDD
jgi:hydroxymethylpyrimidine pyrophosphatase-like HAD family hydrolase